GQVHSWRHRGGTLFPGDGRGAAQARHPEGAEREDLSADEPDPVSDHAVLSRFDDRPADQDPHPFAIQHPLRLDYSVVQHLGGAEFRSREPCPITAEEAGERYAKLWRRLLRTDG